MPEQATATIKDDVLDIIRRRPAMSEEITTCRRPLDYGCKDRAKPCGRSARWSAPSGHSDNVANTCGECRCACRPSEVVLHSRVM
jgi:hypothetical protein